MKSGVAAFCFFGKLKQILWPLKGVERRKEEENEDEEGGGGGVKQYHSYLLRLYFLSINGIFFSINIRISAFFLADSTVLFLSTIFPAVLERRSLSTLVHSTLK